MDKTISKILSEQLTREEFLIKAGIIIIGISGLSSILRKTILPKLPGNRVTSGKGFGSRNYGK